MGLLQQQEYDHKYMHGFYGVNANDIWASTRTDPCAVYKINGRDLSDYEYKEFSGYSNAEDIIYAAGYDGYEIRVIATRNSDSHAVLINIDVNNLNDYEIIDLGVYYGSSILHPYITEFTFPLVCGCYGGYIVVYDTYYKEIKHTKSYGSSYVHALTETKDYVLASLPYQSENEENEGRIARINKSDFDTWAYYQHSLFYNISDDACSAPYSYERYAYFITETDPARVIIFDNDNTDSMRIFQFSDLKTGWGMFNDIYQTNIWGAIATEWGSTEPSKLLKVLSHDGTLYYNVVYFNPSQCNEMGFSQSADDIPSHTKSLMWVTHWLDPAQITMLENPVCTAVGDTINININYNATEVFDLVVYFGLYDDSDDSFTTHSKEYKLDVPTGEDKSTTITMDAVSPKGLFDILIVVGKGYNSSNDTFEEIYDKNLDQIVLTIGG